MLNYDYYSGLWTPSSVFLPIYFNKKTLSPDFFRLRSIKVSISRCYTSVTPKQLKDNRDPKVLLYAEWLG